MPKRSDIHKVLIIGSGPIVIGQACEFDYSGTQACKALRKLGYEIVLVNSNPATIMTDPEIADVTYIEPLNVERLEQIIAKERPDALLPNLGGQSGLNLCAELNKAGILDKYNVKVIGVQVDAIERGEDRIEFKNAMNALGIEMARSQVAYSVEEALSIAEDLGYPVVLRPAYTMGGAGGGKRSFFYAVITAGRSPSGVYPGIARLYKRRTGTEAALFCGRNESVCCKHGRRRNQSLHCHKRTDGQGGRLCDSGKVRAVYRRD